MRKGTVAALLTNVVSITSETPMLTDLTQTFMVALVQGYGRENELEADRLGAEYLAKANYNPEEIIDVLTILKNHETFEIQLAKEQDRPANVYHGLFATHPDNDTRLKKAIEVSRRFEQTNILYS